jgi:hypothetical protein
VQSRVLDVFRGLFEGKKYNHRVSTHGDLVAVQLYEDLLALNRSTKLTDRITRQLGVVNAANRTVGRSARRGDGTFGEAVPGLAAVVVPGFLVPRGRIASVEIGAETKIIAKAMNKQIDRVVSDLKRQVEHFRTSNPQAICVGIVGINHADRYQSFEKNRKFVTDGRAYKHPFQEAVAAEERVALEARPAFDEFLFLRFRASNMRPYPFQWLDEAETRAEYGAVLARIARDYEARF